MKLKISIIDKKVFVVYTWLIIKMYCYSFNVEITMQTKIQYSDIIRYLNSKSETTL